jgi:hypothetical protein
MGVDGGVTGRAGQVLVLPVWDMKMRLRVSELLCETEIDDIDLVATLADPHHEVVGLYVPMDEVARMDIFDARDLVWQFSQFPKRKKNQMHDSPTGQPVVKRSSG